MQIKCICLYGPVCKDPIPETQSLKVSRSQSLICYTQNKQQKIIFHVLLKRSMEKLFQKIPKIEQLTQPLKFKQVFAIMSLFLQILTIFLLPILKICFGRFHNSTRLQRQNSAWKIHKILNFSKKFFHRSIEQAME